jgi:hypothetical protein
MEKPKREQPTRLEIYRVKSLYRQLPVFRRLAYLARAEVTMHDMPECRSSGCLVAVCAAVGTTWRASKVGGLNMKEYLQPRKSPREKSFAQ